MDVICNLIHDYHGTYASMRLTLLGGKHNHVVHTNRCDFYTKCILVVVRVAVQVMRYQLLRMLDFDRDHGSDEVAETACMGPSGKLEVNALIFLLDRLDAFLDSVLKKHLL